MIFSRKKKSAIDTRLHELQKEIKKVNVDIKSLSRSSKARGAVPVPDHSKSAGSGSPENASRDAAQARGSDPDALLSQEQNGKKENTFFPDSDVKSKSKSKSESEDMPLFEPRAQISETGREKFANYFMAGHFANLHPLRQEKRIVRNKAIIMSVLVIIALIWLFYFLYNQ
ncbi:hypothetical protein ACFLQL_02560 [Verrucomicrobiota bacterium]